MNPKLTMLPRLLTLAVIAFLLLGPCAGAGLAMSPARQDQADRALVAVVQKGNVVLMNEFGDDARQLTDDGYDWFAWVASLGDPQPDGVQYSDLRWSPSGRYLLMIGDRSGAGGPATLLYDAVEGAFIDGPPVATTGMRILGWAVDDDILILSGGGGQSVSLTTVTLDGDFGPDMQIADAFVCGGPDGPQVDPAMDVLRAESHTFTGYAPPVQFHAGEGALLYRLDGCSGFNALDVATGRQWDYPSGPAILGRDNSALMSNGLFCATIDRVFDLEDGYSDRVIPLAAGRTPAWSSDQRVVFLSESTVREELLEDSLVPNVFVEARETTVYTVPADGVERTAIATLDAYGLGSLAIVPGDAAVIAAVVANAYDYADVIAADAHYPAVQPVIPDRAPDSGDPPTDPGAEPDDTNTNIASHPDGLVASIASDGNAQVSAPDGSDRNLLTDDGTLDLPYLDPVWSPDGTLLLLTRVTGREQGGYVTESVKVVIGRGDRREIPGDGPCRLDGFMPDSEHLAWHCGEFSDVSIDPDTVDLDQWSMGFLTRTGLDGEDPELVLPYSRTGEPRWGASRPDGRLFQGRLQVAGDGSAVLSNETGIANYLSAYALDGGDRQEITDGTGMLIGSGPEVIATRCSGTCGFPGYHPTLTLERYDLDGTLLQTYDSYPEDYLISLVTTTTDQRSLFFLGYENDDNRGQLFVMDLASGNISESANSWLTGLLVDCTFDCNRFAFQPVVADFAVSGDGPVTELTEDRAAPTAAASPDVYTIGGGDDQPEDDRPSGDGTVEDESASDGGPEAVETPVYRSGDGGGDPILIPYAGWIFFAAKAEGQWDIFARNPRTGESVQMTDTSYDEWAPAGNVLGTALFYLSDVSRTTQLYSIDPGGDDAPYQHTAYSGPGEITYFDAGTFYLKAILTIADGATSQAWLMQQGLYGGDLDYFTDYDSAFSVDPPAIQGPWRSLPNFTPANSIIYVSFTGTETDILVDRADGTTGAIAASYANEDNPALSPDGTRLAYNVENGAGRMIVVQDLTSGAIVEFPQLGDDSDPAWSPDGTQLAFVSNDGANETIWLVPADASAAAEPLGIPEYEQVWYLDWPA